MSIQAKLVVNGLPVRWWTARVVAHLAATWMTIRLYCVDGSVRDVPARLRAAAAQGADAALCDRHDLDRFRAMDLELMSS
jgi:hypothetical protein